MSQRELTERDLLEADVDYALSAINRRLAMIESSVILKSLSPSQLVSLSNAFRIANSLLDDANMPRG